MDSNIFERQSLKTRVTFFTLAIFLISIWSLAFYASRILREDMQRLLGEQQSSTASFLATSINSGFDERLRALELIAGAIDGSLLVKPAALQKRLEDRPILQILFNGGIFATGRDGTAIADFPVIPGRVGTNYIDRESIAVPLKTGKSVIGRPAMGKTLQAPVFSITVPIRDLQGIVIGALCGTINLGVPNFLDKIAEGHYGKTGGYLLIAPQHRLVVTASDKRRVMEALPAPGADALIDRRIEGYEGTEVFVNPRGVEVLNSAKAIPSSGWMLVAALPTAEAFSPIRAVQQRMLLVTIFLTLLAGVLTWWILRRELSPLLTAAKTMASLSHSDQPPPPLPITRQDEIGELIGGFNILLEALGQREKSLRESEQRFRRLTEMSSDFYWESDTEHRLSLRTESKREAEEGVFREASPIGQHRWDYPSLSPDQSGWERHRAILDAHLSFRDFEIARPRVNGAVHYVSVSGDPVFDASGEFLGYRGIGADITERKLNEEALRASEERHRTILQTAMDGFWLVDTQGCLLEANEAYCRMSGYSMQELMTMRIADLEAVETAGDTAAHIQKIMAAGEDRFQSRHHRKDGSVFDVEVSVTYQPFEGGRFVVFLQDTTERKRMETMNLQAQKMEALGTLAGGVAHDFNNIIAAIMGNVELARQDVGPVHDALESLEEIRKASRRAKDLVQQILAFGRKQATEREVISLAPVVQDAGRLLRSVLPAGVSLNVQCDPNAPAVLADTTQIEQILLNLCSNAWQAIPGDKQGAMIEVRLQSHEHAAGAKPEAGFEMIAGEMQPGRYACLTVRDNGSGMDKETLARMFEPFFTTKPVGKGTGLGLAVVHSIAQDHGASIQIRSTPGEGSIFCVCFPAAQVSEKIVRTVTPRLAPTHGQGQHILYIDDDEAIVLLMTRLLERQGYRVSGYTDAVSALAAVRTDPGQFDLAVTDYNMPGMSGLDVARAIKEIRADLPVAMASGYITDELRQQAPMAGVSELIYKPNSVEDLCEMVARQAHKGGEMSTSS